VPAGAHSVALGIDPHHWELVRFTLWEARQESGYEVLHLSTPGLPITAGAAAAHS